MDSVSSDSTMSKIHHTYFGAKGYTILKSQLSPSKQEAIRQRLTVQPMLHGQTSGISFPVFRESTNKMYLPRCVGEELFGPVHEVKKSEGDNINVNFQGQLRENQVPVVEAYMKHLEDSEMKSFGGTGLLELPCAYGKCLGHGTLVMMSDGKKKQVQNIVVGESLMGDDLKPRKVLSLARGIEKMYKIKDLTMLKGSFYIVNESHILTLAEADSLESQTYPPVLRDISVKDYLKLPLTSMKHLYGIRIPFQGLKKEMALKELSSLKEEDSTSSSFSCTSSQNSKKKRTRKIIDLCLQAGVDVVKGEDGFLHYSLTQKTKRFFLYRIGVEEKEIDDYYGFQIDGNRRFLLGEHSVTHNTVLSLNIISKLKKKTLVIVHKEFLLNQWQERVREFLPEARIGKIQGSVFDIEEKDIVFGMLQSLSMKEYDEKKFESFGLTIIDEVHHISSQVFSAALFRIVTKYMLGLSATMNRKDGTTYVFKMFLGEVVYKGDRDEKHDVVVRALTFRSDDQEFNHVETNYIGEVKYSTMISKLCSFQPRSDFVVNIVYDLLKERPGQQIMILAHNKSLLKYLHDTIQKFADTGYYIGGMKEANLKESEGKSVIIATYSMAAEALDIKTLTTLVMATPRTDVEQAVGRILRMKHGQPVVVDIIDTHSTFQNQFRKRKKFYEKEGYKICRS
jgi:hypothetical protein